ncbi:MAG: nicotinate-nucleotide adenylyltransferase [Desulfobacteraceae bacterium]
MNIGLFGGTFNPVHRGHIHVIRYVKELFALDTVYLVPCATPPHKADTDLAPARLRLEMVASAVKDLPGLVPSDIEIKRRGKSYTIDTINQLKEKWGQEDRLFLIMGSDAFLDIRSWKNSLELFSKTPVIVMLRAGEKRKIESLTSFINNRVSGDYRYEEKTGSFLHPQLKPVHLCSVPEIEISSTRIRNRVKQNMPTASMLCDSVETIIRQKGLYL